MICCLVRHGKDDDSVRGGWSASPLTDEGIVQIQALASHILSSAPETINAIYSSDLVRAKQTADILGHTLNLPVIERPEFRETNNGVLAGMDNKEAEAKYPGLYWSTLAWDQPYPGGESPCQFYNRITNAWHRFKEELQNADHNVILVTHGGVINVIRCIENGVSYTNKKHPYTIGNGEMICVEI